MTSLTVASSRSIWARTSVVDALTLLTIVSILGRNSTNMECVISAVGRTLVFTSAASASMCALVLRTDRYKATRMPAWSTTAAVIAANKSVASISIAPFYSAWLPRRMAASQILRTAAFRGGGFLISLPSGFIRRPELLLLLVQDAAATIHPVGGLLASLVRAIAHELPALVGLGTERFPGFAAGTRRI